MSPTFGERLKHLRSARGLSQRALADHLNLSHGTIGMYESGLREPDYETLKRLASFFRTTTDFLLGHTDDPSGSGAIQVALARIEGWQQLVKELIEQVERLGQELARGDLSSAEVKALIQKRDEVRHDLANALGELRAAEADLDRARAEAKELDEHRSPTDDLIYFLRGQDLTPEDVEAVKDLLEARRLRRQRDQQEKGQP